MFVDDAVMGALSHGFVYILYMGATRWVCKCGILAGFDRSWFKFLLYISDTWI